MKQIIYFLIILQFVSKITFAKNDYSNQQSTKVISDSLNLSQIQVGSQIPNIQFEDIINFKSKSINIKDFRGKYLILDFWAIFCTPCIALIPKMEEFQKQFDGELQIMMIALQSKEATKNFYLKRGELGRPISLPSVMDSSLGKLFGISFIPHYVWIDKEGIVRAITDNNQVTKENIKKFINGDELNLPIKADPVAINYDYNTPLLVNGNGGNGKSLKYHSILSGYIEGLGGAYSLKADSCKIVGLNCTIPGLYLIAYGDNNSALPTNLLNLQVRDSSKYIPDLKNLDYWQKTNLYCYELIVPDSLAHKRLAIMRKDLERLFGLQADFETQDKNCFVLIKKSNNLLKTNKGKSQRKVTPTSIRIQNMPISTLIGSISHYHPRKIFLDETTHKGNVDIDIEADILDVESVKRSLSKYGLDIIMVKREIESLTLKESTN